jgi:hypothetical protein
MFSKKEFAKPQNSTALNIDLFTLQQKIISSYQYIEDGMNSRIESYHARTNKNNVFYIVSGRSYLSLSLSLSLF